ncbi:MAG: response regulator transcription factor [Kiritimatiellae bacterium]|jgi:DNA-binding NarL/FixJ family response regulator|nr:response regulator transcription factor [Kiritimatiellia bacterium]
MNSKKQITVLIADDHTIVREGIRKLLETETDIEVIGEADTGRKAVELTRKLHPNVVIMDIAMPQMNGIEATRQIRQTTPDIKILILSAHSDDAYVESVLVAGAAGYLIKQTSAQFLAEAIREVHKGNSFYSPSVSRHIQKRKENSLSRKGFPKPNASNLSSREMEVLQLIAEGDANKQIASTLGISIKTVEKHRDHLMHKLNIHETAGLTRYAIATGIIESSVQLTIV